jgi:hypothetical protein
MTLKRPKWPLRRVHTPLSRVNHHYHQRWTNLKSVKKTSRRLKCPSSRWEFYVVYWVLCDILHCTALNCIALNRIGLYHIELFVKSSVVSFVFRLLPCTVSVKAFLLLFIFALCHTRFKHPFSHHTYATNSTLLSLSIFVFPQALKQGAERLVTVAQAIMRDVFLGLLGRTGPLGGVRFDVEVTTRTPTVQYSTV